MQFLINHKLGRIWFLVWFLVAGVYLIVSAIRRYIEFKTIQFEKVFEREIDGGVMNFYLTCIIIAIALGMLCVFCTVFRTANYANDSMQFGEHLLAFKVMKINIQRDQINEHLIADGSCMKPGVWVRLKCHLPPYYLILYFSMSLTLLLALPYLDSEKIKNGLGSSTSRTHSCLDIIFNMDGKDQSTYFEFFNLCISLVLHTFSYSHVFWKCNKTFSLLFSMVILVHGMIILLDNALVEMLVKLSRDSDSKTYTLSPQAITLLSLLSYFLLFVHQIAFFEYGYIKLTETLLPRFPTGIVNSCQISNDDNNISIPLSSVCKQLCNESWRGILLPLTIGMLSAMLSITFRTLYIYKAMAVIYPQTKNRLILTNLITSVLFITFTIMLWVGLLCRYQWTIKSLEPSLELNGQCQLSMRRNTNNIQSMPIYASVNRHPVLSPPIGQDPSCALFCDQANGQWRYSCSPPSCGPNDSNSDKTVSCTNGDLTHSNKNYIMMRTSNPVPYVADSTNVSHGIYSHLIKLTPENIQTNNFVTDNILPHNIISNDIFDDSSNQTVHIINPGSLNLPRGTLDRSSGRNRLINSSEYFNIVNLIPQTDIYDHTASITTDVASTNLCSQV